MKYPQLFLIFALLVIKSEECKRFEPTSRFIRSLRGQPIDNSKYYKLKSELSHIRIQYKSEDIFNRSATDATLTDWHSAVRGISEKLGANTLWIKELTTAYQRWQRMECDGTECSFLSINFAIEGSGLKHSFGLFGAKVGFSFYLTNNLFGREAIADVSFLDNEDEDEEVELLSVIDRQKMQEFMAIKTLLLTQPSVNKFIAI